MKSKVIINQSKFWLGDNYKESDVKSGDTLDLLRLAAYRRAIGNFVYILTGKNIPVRFAEKSMSLTDGKIIYIGGELSKGEFDPTVGLCLHEAMHIVKSDFDLIKTIWGKLPRSLVTAANGKMTQDEIGKLAKYVLNIVEDRYIDAWAYKSAPGYRGYYHALYDRYFNLPEINKALKSDAYRKSTIHCYKFRLTNIVNNNSDLDALPALRKISELLDLPNILRTELFSAKNRLELAYEITQAIIEDIVADKKEESNSDEDDSSDDSDSENENSDDGADDILGGENSSNSQISEEAEQEDENSNPSQDLTPRQISRVDKLFDKQEKFVLREQNQNAFDSETLKKLHSLEQSGTNLVSVGGEEGIPAVDCVVVENMTRELMESGEFPFSPMRGLRFINNPAKEGVEAGIVLGTMLGRKLQIRGEVKTIKFTRLAKGKIDRRLLAQVGFQGEDLFYQTTTDKFKNVHLHVSVDASSSMADKWKKTMTSLVAIAKAASMVNNVSVSISFRSGVNMNGGAEIPYVVMAYDSRKDKFSKIVNLFPMLFANGSTPEGLAFQAILDLLPSTTHELDSYFVNISDGEPAFQFIYRGDSAALHTKKQVQKIRANGISVLSYFIESGSDTGRTTANTALFRTMYGKDAQFIDVDSVTQVANTLNRLFLTKES